MSVTKSVIVAALMMGVAPAALAQTPPPQGEAANASVQSEDLATRLQAAMAELEAEGFSGFAAIARPGEAPVLVNAGAADPATGRAYDLDTQFDTGSITKPLTGLAVSMLIADGRLDPQATLSNFFDNVPADKAGITVHQMLTHSAGFGDAHGFDLRPMSREQMMEAAFGQTLQFTPGENYSYSNTGFSLIAAIIEEVTGEEYETYMVEDVLRPLGLDSTGYRQALDLSRQDASEEYGPVTQASWGDLNPVSWALVGNGGMVSSADDLLALGQLIAGQGLPGDTGPIWTTPRISEGGDTDYGYGIGTRHIDGIGTIVWHNGGNPAFQTEWWTLLETGQTILVHRNGGPRLEHALGAALSAATGLDLAFAGPDDDIALTEGPIPAGLPEAELVDAFLRAMESEEAWRTFVLARMSAALLEQMPVEEHLAHFPGLSQNVRGAIVQAHAITDDRIVVELRGGSGMQTRLELMPVSEGGTLKLVGIGIS